MATEERPEVATNVLEAAAGEVAYEIQRMLDLDQVPQLQQIRYWRDRLGDALARPGPKATAVSTWVEDDLDDR